jgi:hypothetical protein
MPARCHTEFASAKQVMSSHQGPGSYNKQRQAEIGLKLIPLLLLYCRKNLYIGAAGPLIPCGGSARASDGVLTFAILSGTLCVGIFLTHHHTATVG